MDGPNWVVPLGVLALYLVLRLVAKNQETKAQPKLDLGRGFEFALTAAALIVVTIGIALRAFTFLKWFPVLLVAGVSIAIFVRGWQTGQLRGLPTERIALMVGIFLFATGLTLYFAIARPDPGAVLIPLLALGVVLVGLALWQKRRGGSS